MLSTSKIYSNIKKLAYITLLLIIGWQQWITFSAHKDKFLNPIEYVKEKYGNDEITGYEKRVEGLKQILPKQGRFTYASEQHIPNAGTRDFHFALTQYYLAPRVFFRNNLVPETISYDYGSAPIVTSQIVCDTVLYNLFMSINPNPETDYYLKNGWHEIRNFNNGIVILAK